MITEEMRRSLDQYIQDHYVDIDSSTTYYSFDEDIEKSSGMTFSKKEASSLP